MAGKNFAREEEAHAWCVEIRRSIAPYDWFLSCGTHGPDIFYSLRRARVVQRDLREHRNIATGRRSFPHVRVRRVRLVSWGVAV